MSNRFARSVLPVLPVVSLVLLLAACSDAPTTPALDLEPTLASQDLIFESAAGPVSWSFKAVVFDESDSKRNDIAFGSKVQGTLSFDPDQLIRWVGPESPDPDEFRPPDAHLAYWYGDGMAYQVQVRGETKSGSPVDVTLSGSSDGLSRFWNRYFSLEDEHLPWYGDRFLFHLSPPGSAWFDLMLQKNAEGFWDNPDLSVPLDPPSIDLLEESGKVIHLRYDHDGVKMDFSATIEWLVITGDEPQEDPEVKTDCMKGAWAEWGFKNQGQCVRFVETGKDSR